MANNLTQNPYILDTPGAGIITTNLLRIKKLRWVGATTAGHRCVLSDQFDYVFWESFCPGANYVEESDFTTYLNQNVVLNGIKVTVLGSGKLYLYH